MDHFRSSGPEISSPIPLPPSPKLPVLLKCSMLSLAPFTPCLVQEKRHKFVQAQTDCFRSFVFFVVSFPFKRHAWICIASKICFISYDIHLHPIWRFFLPLSLSACLFACFLQHTHTRVRAHAHPFFRASTSVTTKKTSTIPHPFHHHHRAHRVINAIHTAKPFPKKPFQDW